MQFVFFHGKLAEYFVPRSGEKRGNTMRCKFCNDELMDDVVICPTCGGDNTPAPKPKKNWSVIIAIVCCVALVIGAAAMVISMNAFPESQTEKVTEKSCYTVSNAELKGSMDKVVAKAGDFELTNGELQVIYWSMVYDFVDYMGEYAAYYIDFTKPLSGQYYNEQAGITWEQYFLDMALNTWRRYEVLTHAAEQAGVKLDDTLQNRLDNMYEDMKGILATANFDTVEDMIHHDFGTGADFDDYMDYMDIYYHGNNYYNLMYLDLDATEAEVEAYYTANEQALVSAGYGKDKGTVVEARHLLIEPENKENDEAWAAAKKKAEDLMNQWVDGGAGEDAFADLAYQHSACNSYADGGWLGAFGKGTMVKEFDEWCFAEGHKYGDYGLVQTEFGWHIIFFVDSYELWRENALANVLSEKLYKTMTDLENEFPMVVAYSRIVLGDVKLG